MSFFGFIKKQFIDVIHCVEDDDETLAWRFPMEDMEIQNGAVLTVRDSQMAVFVNEGQIADVFGPGRYVLNTNTLPVLTNLNNWDKLFDSPFKSDVYFFSTRHKLDRKWGTSNPISFRDKEFGMVRMRAFGIYSYYIADPKVFHQKISGTRAAYLAEELEGQLRNQIVATMTSAVASSGVPFIDMAGNQEVLADAVKEKMSEVFSGVGLALESFVVQNVSLPEELQAMLDKKIGVNMMGGLDQYTKFQAADSIKVAAGNEGGVGGLAASAGIGLALGQQIAASLAPVSQPKQPTWSSQETSVKDVDTDDEVFAKIEKLHALAEKGIITQEEFAAKKADLLSKL